MKWFYNLKIGKKLISSFIVMAAITGVVGYLGISNIAAIDDMLNSLYNNETLGISLAKQADVDLLYFARSQKNFLLSATTNDRNKYMLAMNKYESSMKDSLTNL